jgi:hypothetical protein
MNLSFTELERFSQSYAAIHSFYRRGDFEVTVVTDEHRGYVASEDASAIGLRDAAHSLFLEAKSRWQAGASNIPAEFLGPIMRCMTISFEIDEYFIAVSKDKQEFFEAIRREFFDFDDDSISRKSVIKK